MRSLLLAAGIVYPCDQVRVVPDVDGLGMELSENVELPETRLNPAGSVSTTESMRASDDPVFVKRIV